MDIHWDIHATPTTTTAKKRHAAIIAAVLARRGIEAGAQDAFLNPPHPRTLTLANLAVSATAVGRGIELVRDQAKHGGPIVIYGDYDSDGITATAILWETLQSLGIGALPFIPQREKHGYGLSRPGLAEVVAIHHPKLIIAVDNGVTAIDETLWAQDQGVQVIIVDHHVLTGQEHPADSLVHTTQLAGSGLTWVFSEALIGKLDPAKRLESTLELAAIGTVADMVPLVGANRSIVKHGIDQLRHTKRAGICSLISQARLKQDELSAYHLGFQIAPRINAMGRLERAIDSLRLLCTTDAARADALARVLQETNLRRQTLTDEMTLAAAGGAETMKTQPAIVIANPAFHEGIIGLIAGKIAQQLWRPTVIISQGEKFSKASARSIPGFDITAALRELESYFEGVGGHPMAAGFTIKTKNIPAFTKAFMEVSARHLTPDLLTKMLPVDAEILFSDVSAELVQSLQRLHPLGIGNPSPVFATSNVTIKDLRAVGAAGKHLKLALKQQGDTFLAIGFGLGNLAGSLLPGQEVAVAYTPELSTWNGRTRIELKLKDIKFIT